MTCILCVDSFLLKEINIEKLESEKVVLNKKKHIITLQTTLFIFNSIK